MHVHPFNFHAIGLFLHRGRAVHYLQPALRRYVHGWLSVMAMAAATLIWLGFTWPMPGWLAGVLLAGGTALGIWRARQVWPDKASMLMIMFAYVAAVGGFWLYASATGLLAFIGLSAGAVQLVLALWKSRNLVIWLRKCSRGP